MFNFLRIFLFLKVSIVSVSLILAEPREVKQSFSDDTIIVVIHSGHGGRTMAPKTIYGDKWSKVKGHYLISYHEGAIYKKYQENEITYKIAKSIQEIYKGLSNINGKRKFQNFLRKFGNDIPFEKNISVDIQLIRKTNFYDSYFESQEDPNAPYRLYDYPDIKTNEMKDGVISRINQLKPHLVISLHINQSNSKNLNSIFSVITPSYSTYVLGKKYLLAENSKKRNEYYIKFQKSGYANWFMNSTAKTTFSSFLLDVSSYFTGNWCNYPELSLRNTKYSGYRYNMLQWRYMDKDRWVILARKKSPNTPYSGDIKTFSEKGSKFWKREKNQYEQYRREKGPEGIGGDNLYASEEILRYLRIHLSNSGIKKNRIPYLGEPVISTWSLPTYTNAIHAFIELGNINHLSDRKNFKLSYSLYAEAIAVGIYSLIYSMKPFKNSLERTKGLAIDFSKYDTYFQDVVNE